MSLNYFLRYPPDKWDASTLVIETLMEAPAISFDSFQNRVFKDVVALSESLSTQRCTRVTAMNILKNWKSFGLELKSEYEDQMKYGKTDEASNPSVNATPVHASSSSSSAPATTSATINNIKNSGIVQQNYEIQDKETTATSESLFDTLESVTGKKRALFDDDFDNEDSDTSNALSSLNSTDDEIEESKSPMDIWKNGKLYQLHPTKHLHDSPHRPKIQKTDSDTLANRVLIANSSTTPSPTIPGAEKVTAEYQQALKDQQENVSLQQLPGIMGFLREVLNLDEADFVENLWNLKIDSTHANSQEFATVLKYSMTDLHLNCRAPPNLDNHERTAFVEHVIPSIKALAKVTNLLKMSWCEKDLAANKMILMSAANYITKNASVKKMDALGISQNSSTAMESLLVESSSGLHSEAVAHTLDDTIKLVECSIMALKNEAASRKDCDWEIFKNTPAFTIHVICDQITLSKTTFLDSSRWAHVQLRSSQIPASWNKRILYFKFAELLATLYLSLKEMDRLSARLDESMVGLIPCTGKTVRDTLA
ncbi:hypothetical protein DM01DRAFT_1317064 [Hesseltinella vesiculosa]|uniref:Uncharacterized protein n=1 Tax=Hesseltinella vesiculosa TaxID=101127 RepID=A0A1X2GSW1_9FUNG|nr:hypothetical protein DM01DRAFT_1317064 [Hesseltinella vesiculosa]